MAQVLRVLVEMTQILPLVVMAQQVITSMRQPALAALAAVPVAVAEIRLVRMALAATARTMELAVLAAVELVTPRSVMVTVAMVKMASSLSITLRLQQTHWQHRFGCDVSGNRPGF